MQFTAIDVETANSKSDSICAIGVARFQEDSVIDEQYTLVNPQDFFDPFNTDIHGITEEDVKDAPEFPDALRMIAHLLEGTTVVSHTSFDRTRMRSTAETHSVPLPQCQWVDSAALARFVWPEISKKGWGLAEICKKIGHKFQHHHALEDAKACGRVVLAATAHAGYGIEEILDQKRVAKRAKTRIATDGNPEGRLFGEVVVFTGALSISRREAAQIAAEAGCRVGNNVNNETTMLVVGDLDVRRLGGHTTRSKHRNALSLIGAGSSLQIISYTTFNELVNE